MDGNQLVSDDANQLTEIPNIRELVARSMAAKRLGRGLQGVVYEFDDEAKRQYPILDKFLVKRFRTWTDFPTNDANSFLKNLSESESLIELPDELGGRNFGQAVFKDNKGTFAILLRQQGQDITDWIRDTICEGRKLSVSGRYDAYLDWLRNLPDDAFLDLADKIAFVKSRGFHLDHVKKDNLFWDNDSGRFNLIDLFAEVVDPKAEAADPVRKREVHQRPIQKWAAGQLGVADLTISEEMLALFKEQNKRIVLSLELPKTGFIAKDKGIEALETMIEWRINKLHLDEKFKDTYPHVGRMHTPSSQLPAIQMDAPSIELQGKLGEVHSRTAQT
ncbi:MAG: hypothetical protein J0M34_04485 [Alphaproteobacteria bacterium]|nr:hypothetical protein [Alphaproteobacteria bacterium]